MWTKTLWNQKVKKKSSFKNISVGLSVGWFVSFLANQLIGHSVSLMVGWLAGQSVNQLAGLLVVQLV